MASDTSKYNSHGTDSSGSSSAESPLSMRGGSSMPQSLGSVQTDFADADAKSGDSGSED